MKILKHIILNSRHNNRKFRADIRYSKNNIKKPIVIFIHGFKGFKDWGHFNLIADSVANDGFVFVKPNLSHNGTTIDQPFDFADLEAFSENNFCIELDDIGSVIDYLFSDKSAIPKEEVDLNRIFLIGHSRGGSLVILKVHEDDRIKAVTALAPIHDLFERWSDDTLKKWKDEGVTYITMAAQSKICL